MRSKSVALTLWLRALSPSNVFWRHRQIEIIFANDMTAKLTHYLTPDMELNLRYFGPALEDGRMGAKQIGPAIFAMAAVLEQSANVLYPDAPPLRVDVKGNFKRGSFQVYFVATTAVNDLIGTLTSDQLANLCTIIGFCAATGGGVIAALKRLKRRKIDSVTTDPSGNFHLTVIGDNTTVVVSPEELKLLRNEAVISSLEGVVEPLKLPGVDGLEVREGSKRKAVTISKRDVRAVAAPSFPDEPVKRRVFKTRLILKAPDFGEGNKWRFETLTGGSTIYADVLDDEFWDGVNSDRERFTAHEVFYVDLLEEVHPTPPSPRYSITRVHSHTPMERSAQETLELEAGDDEPEAGDGT